MMRKTEDHHHTPQQVENAARAALEIADAIGLDDADRAALLPTMLTLLSSKQVFYEQAAPLPAMAIPRNHGR
jgi:hypothetical protein